jgi:hypothetical protein
VQRHCWTSTSSPCMVQTGTVVTCKRIRHAWDIPFFLCTLNVCGCVLLIGSFKSSINKDTLLEWRADSIPPSTNSAVTLKNVNWYSKCIVGDFVCWLKNDHLSTADGRRLSGGSICCVVTLRHGLQTCPSYYSSILYKERVIYRVNTKELYNSKWYRKQIRRT